MIRYGVVGVGYFGADLACFMNEFDNAKITAVYDPENGQTIAEELKCDAANSLEELVMRNDVDCVIVATPLSLVMKTICYLSIWNLMITALLYWNGDQPSVGANIMC
nr:Gfo/Idh/MocA family oxidoreductase [Glaesserella parasuis]